jgi:iron complex transport system ATP-binding protein
MNGLIVDVLTMKAGGKTIVGGASLRADAGAITGLVGPNGAGKSTLLSGLLGLRPIVSGSARFEGSDLLAMPRRQRAQICAYVEQSASTEERLTVADVVGLGRIPFQSIWQQTDEQEAIVGQALADVGLAGLAPRLYTTLSGGERQRVQLARALAQQPRLMVLDEPTSHLDIHAQIEVLDLLRRTAAAGTTVVIALHDLNLAMRYCDRLAVMQSGHVVAEGMPDAVLTPELLGEVYGVAARRIEDPLSGRPVIVFDGTVVR